MLKRKKKFRIKDELSCPPGLFSLNEIMIIKTALLVLIRSCVIILTVQFGLWKKYKEPRENYRRRDHLD